MSDEETESWNDEHFYNHKTPSSVTSVTFGKWLENIASIKAPKVELVVTNKSNTDNQIISYYRGLYATKTIHHGECFIRVPAACILSDATIQSTGEELLSLSSSVSCDETVGGLGLADPRNDTRSNSCYSWRDGSSSIRNQQHRMTRRIEMAQETMFMIIERYRRFVVPNNHDPIEEGESSEEQNESASHQQRHEWRDDDGMMLFLMASRSILNNCEYHDINYGLDEQEEENGDVEEIKEVTPTTNETTTSNNDDHTNSRAITDFLPYISMLPTNFPTHPLFYSEDEMRRIEGTNCHELVTRIKTQVESDWKAMVVTFELYWANDMDWRSTIIQSGSNCTNEVSKPDSAITTSHDYLFSCFSPKAFLTLDAYRWALTVIQSRCTDSFKNIMHLPKTPHTPQIGNNNNSKNNNGTSTHHQQQHHTCDHRIIIPLVDMINHNNNTTNDNSINKNNNNDEVSVREGKAYCSMDADGNIILHAQHGIHEGDEIVFDYGNFTNEKLLMVYGFIISNNPFEAVQLYAPLSLDDPLLNMKARILLSSCGVQDFNEPYLLCKSHRDDDCNKKDNDKTEETVLLPIELMSVLRLIGIQSMEELITVTRVISNTGHDDNDNEAGNDAKNTKHHNKNERYDGIPFISFENEYNALMALGAALESMTRRVALSLISDDELNAASMTTTSVTNGNKEENSAADNNPGCQEMKALAVKRVTMNSADINKTNAKILCEGQYEILRLSLMEVNLRLEQLVLTHTTTTSQDVLSNQSYNDCD